MLNEINNEPYPTSGEIFMDDVPFEQPVNTPREPQTSGYTFEQSIDTTVEAQPNNYASQTSASTPTKKRTTIKEYKKHARSDMDWGRLTGAMIVAIVASSLLQGIVTGVSSFISNETVALILSLVGTLLMMFISSGIVAGLLCVFLEVKRGRNETGVLGRFDRMLPMLGVILLASLLIYCPLIVAGIVLAAGFVLQNQIVLLAGIGLMFAACVLSIILSLKYSQSVVLCADGHGVMSSLKTSKKIMKGRKLQYLGLQLSFMGWILLGVLFGALINVLIGTIPFYFVKEVSTVGVVGANLNTVVAIYIALFPTLLYMSMTQIEFYEDVVGNGLNPFKEKTTKKPIWVVALLTLLVSLVSAGMFMLPVAKVSADNARVSLGGVNFEARKGYLGFTTNTTQTPVTDIPTIEVPDGNIGFDLPVDEPAVEEPIAETPIEEPVNTDSTPLMGIKYTIPAGYEALDESDTSAYYIKDADSISLYKSEAYNGLSYLEEYYSAEKVNINGIDCYYYYTGDTFKEYNYCFEHNGYEYDIRATVDSDARSVVESIVLN